MDLLYHGTTEAVWREIEKAGAILPRGMTARSNWNHTVKSHEGLVYLTDCYAGYFGLCALENSDLAAPGARLAVIEIAADAIVASLTADEDALEQSSRSGRISNAEMKRRTAAARGKLAGLAGSDAWRASIDYMGTCAHVGPIPLNAIRRVALVDIQANPVWALDNLQPVICAANYRFCGDNYRALTAQAFEIGEVQSIAETVDA